MRKTVMKEEERQMGDKYVILNPFPGPLSVPVCFVCDPRCQIFHE